MENTVIPAIIAIDLEPPVPVETRRLNSNMLLCNVKQRGGGNCLE